MRTTVIIGFVLLMGTVTVAQVPVINKVEPLAGAPQQTILITGGGFSSTLTDLQVWFDHVPGIILSSNKFTIQVQIPAQARLSNVEVINLVTGLSAKSVLKFTPQYGGVDFDATKVTAPFSVSDPNELFDICSCDFDLDGKPDLATTKSPKAGTPTDLMILKNQSTPGTISFLKKDKTTLAALDVLAPTFNINCGDLNGDGKPDLVATRNGATRNQVFVLQNTNSTPGTLSFASFQTLFLDIGQFAFRVSIRDLNLDGKPELIVSNSFDDPNTDNIIYVFVNQSTTSGISFVTTPLKFTVTGANTTYGLDVQDLDGDAKPEIIVNQFQTNNVYIFKNQSTGQVSFAPVRKITVTGAFNNVTTADMNKDGLLDLILTATFDNSVQLFINQSTATSISFKAPQTITTSLSPWGVDISDIDGDGDPDIIVANITDNKINVLRQDASLSFTKLDLATPKFARNVRVGDYDGDGKPDIAFTSFSTANSFSVDVIRNTNCVSPKILNTTPLTICNPQTIRLTTTPALNVLFSWSKNGGPGSAPSANEYFDITTSGSYTVTATGESGACVITSPAIVVASDPSAPPPNPTVGSNSPLCVNSSLQLSTPAVGGFTYQWTGPNGFTSNTQNPTLSNVTVRDAGLYYLQLNVGVCTSNKISTQVDLASLPVFTISSSSPGAVCQGSSVTLTLTSNPPGYTYQWMKNGTTISGQTGLSLAVTQEGDYSVMVTSSAPVCNQETTKTTVIMLAVPVANFQIPAAVCTGTATNFTDQSVLDIRGTAKYAWTFGDGNNSAAQNPSNTYLNPANLNVSLTASYVGVTGCSNSISKPITASSPVVPVIAATANPICVGEASTLSVAGSFKSFTWNAGGSGNSIGVTKPGDYTVNTLDQNNCPSNASITIKLKPPLSLTVSADKTSISPGEPVQLTASGADSYVWTPGLSLTNPTISNPVATPSVTTTYQVTGSKSGFCDARDSVQVIVNAGGTAIIDAPLIFSPNGDAANDTWIIPGVENYTDCTMSVYDGHGSKVYETRGYSSGNTWDGTYNGKVVPAGTYFYVFGCPNLKPATGNVLVVR
jgi:gliding motility-associated-like protein